MDENSASTRNSTVLVTCKCQRSIRGDTCQCLNLLMEYMFANVLGTATILNTSVSDAEISFDEEEDCNSVTFKFDANWLIFFQ